jgi:pyrroline-5-carboxylate reductase
VSTSVAIIGVGNMGRAVLAGLVASGHDPASIYVGTRREEHAAQLRETYGVVPLANDEAVRRADVVVLGVKPYDVVALLTGLEDAFRDGQLVISLAAGITTAAIEAAVPGAVEVVRVMPNTPADIGEGMAIVSPGASASDENVVLAELLMASTGKVVRLAEKHIDAAAAISGSGPAYVFYVAEAMIEAGVHLGLTRAVASELTTQTLVGASLLLRETGEHPAVLRENVTSPGGTTAAALREFETHRLRAAFLDATRANVARSREIAQGS